MKLFQLVSVLDAEVTPDRCKIHLASSDGREDPLDVYLAGDFDDWQKWQRRRNFEQDFVVALVALPETSKWLFAGVYESRSSEWREDKGLHEYELTHRESLEELSGRLVVNFGRPGRQAYLKGERWADALEISELHPEKMTIGEFPGYSRVLLTKQRLDIVVQQQVASWKAALSNVGGVYIIADRATGKLYVGSATGEEGLWSRWCAYSETGHGGNVELRQIVDEKGGGGAEHFQFGVLEIADSHATDDDVRARESRWKELLLARTHGYNAN